MARTDGGWAWCGGGEHARCLLLTARHVDDEDNGPTGEDCALCWTAPRRVCRRDLHSANGQWPGTVSPYTMIGTCSPRRDAAPLLLPQCARPLILCTLAYNTHRSRHATRSVRRLPRAKMLMTMAVTPPPPRAGATQARYENCTTPRPLDGASALEPAQNLTIRGGREYAPGQAATIYAPALRTTLRRSDWLCDAPSCFPPATSA